MPKVTINEAPAEVVRKVNEYGLELASAHYHTSKASLSRWLIAHGYRARPQYKKEAPTNSKN